MQSQTTGHGSLSFSMDIPWVSNCPPIMSLRSISMIGLSSSPYKFLKKSFLVDEKLNKENYDLTGMPYMICFEQV